MSTADSADNSAAHQRRSEMTKVNVNAQRAADLVFNLSSIRSRISATLTKSSSLHAPRLVAVSKLKPASDILSLHTPPDNSEPHLHFGENYVQELLEKSRLLPKTVRWHFIGGLQSNKCLQLARDVVSLWAVESLDSEKKAAQLDKGRRERNSRLQTQIGGPEITGTQIGPLKVFIQVNTSGEDSKSGVNPAGEEVLSLAKFVRDQCANLQLQGLMTIGAIARSKATTPETENEDFVCLRDVRDMLAQQLGIDKHELELSMGMSEDFEGAILQGSSEVRIGSTIFGERPPKSEAKVLETSEEGQS